MTDVSTDGIEASPDMTGENPQVDKTYTMTVELSVLESLGINLYSNAAAVLSELVANAYDADAGVVDIKWQPRAPEGEAEDQSGQAVLLEVIVSDDGVGMNVEQLNQRFLTAGYKKRSEEGTVSPTKNRPYMGRKGIGKLSVFSLGRTVEVFSKTETGEAHGFRIRVEDLEESIQERLPYHPAPISVPAKYNKKGTTIIMSELKSKRANLTASALRKRLARRFDVLDPRTPDNGGFHLVINDERVTWKDRQELKKLEFLWEFGTQTLSNDVLPTGIQRFVLPTAFVDADKGWKVGGWFGTSKTPTDLIDDLEAGSLKNIIVLARKRPIQEGIIEKLDFSKLFGNYVTGQVEADFLDLDDPEYEDIATSDRQRLIEDDERVLALQGFLRSAFLKAAEQWSEARPKREAVDALARYPKLKAWVADLPEWQRPSAEAMVGTIASLDFEKKNEARDRSALFRSGVLAFARVGLRQSSDDLALLSNVTAQDLLPLLGQQDAYEAGLWSDILRSRVEAIEQLQGLTDSNQKEAVLQRHLFEHLWLLDASWERATGSSRMEENLRRIEPGLFAMDDEQKEITGRIDIRYRTVSGRHVIVELKRYDLTVDARTLAEQGVKYASALADILRQQQRDNEIPGIQVIFVLGRKPGTQGMGIAANAESYYRSVFESSNGSYRLYDALIENARNQYQDYLDASVTARNLDELISTLDGS
ncbi:ATP-binding protein [Arthrobacter sp. AL08]|uniref:BbrUII/HgiDII family restriction enzyme n=1 Tax=Micrococcaceae TaxID=1268 RepID=UPI00249BBE11|nr:MULTISPECIES: ATP-binding protein [Micrococcaceae]MDI3242237.1 ATP-binding protein [Arthrobacter sp. AL05]MDI3278157.1 ATP-binding protein [Arthrobacter sp. AL08]MDJ0353169.1 ATP-binding protein [Pseudarthrobacter sp. PH31-O2]